MLETISDIPNLVTWLRDADPKYRVFGSEKHRYHLPPPLSEREVAVFESDNGVTLPEDYREYLLTVADGGAGPFYGMQSLKIASQYRTMSKPFPFTVATDTLSKAERDQHGDRDEYGGILELCHQGCAINSYLVVCGPTTGTIWDGREDFYPLQTSFAQWFCQWATKTLTLLLNASLVDQLQCGMTTTDVIAAVGGDWKRRTVGERVLFEASEIPIQLEIDGDDVVRSVMPWPYL